MKNRILQFWTKLFLLSCFIAVNVSALQAQVPQLAFPGAEGFGRNTTGGRGGIVYEVTNLNDDGAGSLRLGCALSGPRTIVFRVSGTIALKSDIRIRTGNLTIAGQTSPEGICTKDYQVSIEASQVIIRYMRFRVGRAQVAANPLTDSDPDACHMNGDPAGSWHDVIIDHCSMSWSVDETGSFYDNANFTLQWCILSESLYNAGHKKGVHGYGGIQGGRNASFHHNLYADHTSRNPRFNGARWHQTTYLTELVDFRNNVIFNWGFNSAYGGEWGQQNMVNNYFKSGPATDPTKKFRIVEIAAGILDNNTSPPTDARDPGKWFITGNYVEGSTTITNDNWAGGVQGNDAANPAVKVSAEFGNASTTIVTELATDAYTSVLANAGANFPGRDAVDTRIINQVTTGVCTTGGSYGANKGIIDSCQTVGGWPNLNTGVPAVLDQDHDGMDDNWETNNGLNPNYPDDRNFIGADGYSMLEKYLNCLISASPCPSIPAYTLNINTNGGVGSNCLITANPLPVSGKYPEGSLVTLTATAATDSILQNWTGDATGTTNSIVVKMSGDKNVTANFISSVGMIFRLKTSVIGPGSVTFSPVSLDSTYVSGAVVQVTAVPDPAQAGNSFTSWSGDLSGTTNPISITMNNNKTITAKFFSAISKKVAYVTDPNPAGTYPNDTLILKALKNDPRFTVTELNANSTTNDYSPYDLVILSEVPNSAATGIPSLKGINKPFLMMKVHAYKSGVWSWITPAAGYGQNTSALNIVVNDKNHPMFDGVTFVNGNEVNMLSSVGVNGTPKGLEFMDTTVTPMVAVSNGFITTIATIKDSQSELCILEIKGGTIVASSVIPQDFIQIGINSTSYGTVTPDAVKIVLNACYYLSTIPLLPTGIHSFKQLSNIACYPTIVNDVITIDLSESKAGNATVSILSLTGQSVYSKELASGQKSDLNLEELTPGLYFCKIQNAEGVATKKIIKK